MEEYHYFKDTFNDEFYDLVSEDIDELYVYDLYKPHIGDVVIYKYKTKLIETLPKERVGKELDNAIIGIVVLVNKDDTMDVLMKNFITKEHLLIPFMYRDKPKFIPAYLKDLFDRYCNKYLRTSEIDLSLFNYCVPSIALLDFVLKNILTVKNTLVSIYGEDYTNIFFERLYSNGLFSIHKNKYYKWLPVIGEKRKILNFEALQYIEFLPICTVSYNNID